MSLNISESDFQFVMPLSLLLSRMYRSFLTSCASNPSNIAIVVTANVGVPAVDAVGAQVVHVPHRRLEVVEGRSGLRAAQLLRAPERVRGAVDATRRADCGIGRHEQPEAPEHLAARAGAVTVHVGVHHPLEAVAEVLQLRVEQTRTCARCPGSSRAPVPT